MRYKNACACAYVYTYTYKYTHKHTHKIACVLCIMSFKTINNPSSNKRG